MLPEVLFEKFRIASYQNAAAILNYGLKDEFSDIVHALTEFSITTEMIRKPGGNESEIPKVVSSLLRSKGWYETSISGDLEITKSWREQLDAGAGKPRSISKEEKYVRQRYLDGHKIDYVKGRVAFDFEWNSKDQTFDRDLYAFAAFANAGAIDVAIIVTRDTSLNEVFKRLTALDKNGNEVTDDGGNPKSLMSKFGASTTWWGKLIFRLNAGRQGGCPVLAFGIKSECILDL